ncbi:peptidoglycan DD-metalloendopeptidase family protein [Intrasporangium sp. DVR]|uniref:M23 family metallopeptidase n=1 Tax=Intrasporangium sp. DVR TaxID=3127867 RepID=UPI00333F37D7
MIHIRMRGRTLTFATGVTLFALLPFLGGSAPQLEKQSVVLAAGAAVAAPAPATPSESALAYPQGVTPEMSGALSGLSTAIGGGLFQFPSLVLSPALAPSLTPPGASKAELRFILPVPGPQSSSFGPRMHPVLGVPMFHTGIDLSAACGTPIRAAASGTVVYAEVSPSWGARTIIEHSPTLKTAYGHQSRFLVKEGDVVKQGEIIGLVGTTGWSTGCHLHFDVILNDRYVDPAPYLGMPSSHAPSIPFQAAPHVVRDDTGGPSHTVEDGDVPIPTTTPGSIWTSTPTTTRPPATIPPSPTPTIPDPTTTDPTTTPDPTTPDPTTTDPTTTPDPTTPDPTTTDPTTSPDATSTGQPTESTTSGSAATSEPSSTTTSGSSGAATTSEPAPAPTSEPAPTTTSEPAPAPTSEPAPAPTSEPAPTTTSEPAPAPTSEPASATTETATTTTSDTAEASSTTTTTAN